MAAYGAIAVTSTPVAIVPGPSDDVRLYIQNRGPSELFIGPTSAVTAANGTGLAAGTILEYPTPGYMGTGYDLWVVTAASGSADVRWMMI